jgi:hypothetical protein
MPQDTSARAAQTLISRAQPWRVETPRRSPLSHRQGQGPRTSTEAGHTPHRCNTNHAIARAISASIGDEVSASPRTRPAFDRTQPRSRRVGSTCRTAMSTCRLDTRDERNARLCYHVDPPRGPTRGGDGSTSPFTLTRLIPERLDVRVGFSSLDSRLVLSKPDLFATMHGLTCSLRSTGWGDGDRTHHAKRRVDPHPWGAIR